MLQPQRGVAESDKTEQLNNNTTQQKAEKVAILMASWDIGNFLEARIHPVVKRRIDEWFAADAEGGGDDGGHRLKVAIIPLLFEVHWDAEYDIILCVASSVERQIERMTAMRGYSLEEAMSRLSAQMDLSEKARKSHVVIQNDGSAEDLRREAERVVRYLAGVNRR